MDTIETWPRCPEAAAFFQETFQAFAAANPAIQSMAQRFLEGAGVSLLNLVDHWTLPSDTATADTLASVGLTPSAEEGETVWEHPQARLPRVRLAETHDTRLALAAEDIALFLKANALTPTTRIGSAADGYEEARCPLQSGELAVVTRQGCRGFGAADAPVFEPDLLEEARAALQDRDRHGEPAEVIAQTRELFTLAAERLGRDRAVDEFFAAERDYYTARNRAARWQYEQQQRLGFGWANQDHHTYRCARGSFRDLMRLWEIMGFQFRERFYAGAEAGWGAQVLEHPVSRVVIFADVDVAPEELNIDFASQQLPPRPTLGTIGLWCALHGDSIGVAGMHHLEAEFDFVRAVANLRSAGFGVMAPFTDLPMLRQAFTEAEPWQVPAERAKRLVAQGALTAEQADRFMTHGAHGSHLEILQRWEGFKGFNKTGVSAIIRETDARRS